MVAPSGPAWPGRLARVQAALGDQRVGALVVSTPLNIKYLTGFSGSAGLLLITPRHVILIVDGRYDLVVRRQIEAGRIAPVELEKVAKRYDLTLADVLAREAVAIAGFEPAHVTVSTLGGWQRAAPGVAWTPVEKAVERLRVIKDAAEIEIFRKAGKVISGVVAELPSIVGIGRTEREIAVSLETAILRAGFSALSFPIIVASGPNSALPHAVPTDRRVEQGDLVVLDFGGVLDGYCVDLTRMAAAGPISSDAKSLFDAVLAAHASAAREVRPGIQTSEIDRAARDVLEARGLGDAFSHSTGHGLGLEVHEAPRVGRADPDTSELVEAGMVITIEPGAYLESVGGVRLEDDVLVTPAGSEMLTTASRDLIVV